MSFPNGGGGEPPSFLYSSVRKVALKCRFRITSGLNSFPKEKARWLTSNFNLDIFSYGDLLVFCDFETQGDRC